MRIVHTSDWHLGQNFYRFDREEEHLCFFEQLAEVLRRERPDALVVSGDVFHNSAPSISAQRLFVEGVMMLADSSPETTIVITAGNHDSGSRLDAERLLWRRLGVHVVGGCQRLPDGTFDPNQFVVEISGKGYIIAAPYFHTSNYPLASADMDREDRQRGFFDALLGSVGDTGLPVVMMAHLAVAGCDTLGHEDEPVGGMLKENLSELGEGYDYLALGHIHRPQQINPRVYYSGSPLPLSFSEAYSHFVNIVEIAERGALPTVEQVGIVPQRRVKTVPQGGAPLQEALDSLGDLDDADDSYIRVLVDQEDVIAADAEDRARKIVDGKACRFCEIRRKPRKYVPKNGDLPEITEIEDFTQIKPIDIVRRSYERKTGTAMNDLLIEMMNRAIELAEE